MIKKAAAVKGGKNGEKINVSASGRGGFAEKIIQTAKDYNVPLKEDPDLAEVLSSLDIYEDIPADLYEAVADILAELYRINKRL